MALKELKDGDRRWLPKWLSAYAKFHGVENENVQSDMDVARAIAFLRSLRDRNVEAWRRLPRAKLRFEFFERIQIKKTRPQQPWNTAAMPKKSNIPVASERNFKMILKSDIDLTKDRR